MPILEVNNIKKKFENTEILKGISFSMEEGQTISIIGSSGSGKTTLLRCLNLLERADEGIITVRGEKIFDAADELDSPEILREKRLHFGMVFQQFNLFPQYTALGNVTLAPGLLNDGRSMAEIEKMGKELLDQMGLSDRMNNYPHQLSGGQQQRVAIARALAMKPDILCFDEPTSALDPELTGEVLRVIRELANKHMTMIIVTHEMAFARDVADEVIFMDEGIILEKGPAKEVITNPKQERTKRFLQRMNS
ncbi:amino acid ABC transporter ATP-binding protein [Butyrivibrio sp. YAB3001]|uniref:amino acid ABC transporter ATP-binding protein n=1 Tax=Butyrivibrio sp. YAB3001 TaxID=1520812 RepID=UPI0008F645E8|nr:amino acid ABC transporter ATP-binding protein [Butyrivibrio sp. YAB3001]SFC90204.1 polar amino acid transport system ATP-binding protein [Butyrivibrio sp. YAB3001]